MTGEPAQEFTMSDQPRAVASAASSPSRQQAWSRYWASGARHSCVGSFADDYAGAIRRFWEPHLSALQPRDRMLDIGTGNGPLVKLAVDVGSKQGIPPRVDAVDLAKPAPDWLASMPPEVVGRLHFHAGVAAEALPFSDASFELVTSQFGIEYADLDMALDEVFRVVASTGRVALVCHHRDSVLFAVAGAECGHLQWLLDESGLFAATEALLPVMARLATPEGAMSVQRDTDAARVRGNFNQRMQALSTRAAQQAVPDCLHETAQALMALLSAASQRGSAASLQDLQRLGESLADSALRSRELQAHALDEARADAVLSLSEAAGRRAVATELVDAGRLIGWGIEIGPRQ